MEPKASKFTELDANPDKASFGTPRRPMVTPVGVVSVEPTVYEVAGKRVELPTFEIGLVLAGAVSAGAYTAGVLDYLIEALDAWEREKERNVARFADDFARWTVPPHAVRLVAVAGASAGSVCAAILAATACKRFPSGAGLPTAIRGLAVSDAPHPNPLYDLWVRRLDILGMLDSRDLSCGMTLHEVESALNTEPLDEGAAHIVSLASTLPHAPRRRWLDAGVTFGFTLGNLTGVPYVHKLVGLDGADFATRRHADIFAFRILGAEIPTGLPASCVPGSPICGPSTQLSLLAWDDVANAALASGAFPVALKPRMIARTRDSYDREIRLDARYLDPAGPAGAPDAAAWKQGADVVAGTVTTTLMVDELHFTAVDGGTMNNQPFEFVRRTLAGPMGRNPRKGDEANRAVILIDPFPAQPEKEAETETKAARRARMTRKQKPVAILDVLPRLLGAYVNQARYDANDLALAADPDIYSRFMLSPIRRRGILARGPAPDAKRSEEGETLTGARALASGGLGAFAGFLGMPLRHHDFLLGRRNAEYFLRTYLTLPHDNRLFNEDYWCRFGTPEAPLGPYWSINADPQTDPTKPQQHSRQIIPVILPRHLRRKRNGPQQVPMDEGARIRAARSRLLQPHPDWPGYPGFADDVLKRIERPLYARAKRFVFVVRDSFTEGWTALALRQLLRIFAGKIAERAAQEATGHIRAGLKEAGLDQTVHYGPPGPKEATMQPTR